MHRAPTSRRPAVDSPRRARARAVATACALALATAAIGCGIESRSERQAGAQGAPGDAHAHAETEPSQSTQPDAPFEWPAEREDRPVVTLEVRDHGRIRIALYPELAPETVESFTKLARDGFYDGTAFHRVIPGFMVQGGDPFSRDDDPRNDGQGGPGYQVPDEFSNAPHRRGVVSLANRGQPNSGGSQFFIVHGDSRHLDGKYAVFGFVIEGMDVVDTIAGVEIDTTGRWGPKNRPLEAVVVESVRVEGGGEAVAKVDG